jgi:integrase
MVPAMPDDNRYLFQRGQTWWAAVECPPSLRPILGRRLAESLKTRNLIAARDLRHAAVARMKAEIAQARRAHSRTAPLTLDEQALRWRSRIEQERDGAKREALIADLAIRAVEAPLSPRKADHLYRVGRGERTPVQSLVDDWLAESVYTARTKADHRHAIGVLTRWLRENYSVAAIEAVDDKLAARFRLEALVKAGVNRKTSNKLLSGLRSYWKWMVASGHATSNPWTGKSLPKGRLREDERERPFSDDEVLALLRGDADPTMRDVIIIGLLSGLRLEEIFQLQVRDVTGGRIKVRRSKTESGERTFPAHSGLTGNIARRSEGKRQGDYLIEEGNPTGWDGARSMAFSKRFRTYRERVGVDDREPGRRRSRVNFHSCRRWFASKCDEAGCRESDVARILGHSVKGMSFGVYSGGTSLEQLRSVVESVRLPVSPCEPNRTPLMPPQSS